MTSVRRRKMQVDMLGGAIDALRAAVARLVVALPARPALRDEAALAGIAAELPGIASRMQRAGARLRRDAPADEIRDLLETARVSLREIPRVAAALELVLARRAEPLMEPRAPVSAATRRAEVLSRGFNDLELAVSGEEQAEEMHEHAFPFIPLGAESFVARLQAAWRLLAVTGNPQEARFLEVGAGAGSKLFLAAQFFPVVEGIELDANYLARAELVNNMARPERRVFAADALGFADYGAYDVIYSYLPPLDLDLQAVLERRILGAAREGAIIIAPMMRSGVLGGLAWLEGEIIVKGYDGDALSRLAAEARLVGTAVPPVPRGGDRGGRRNLMAPAVDALARAGFAT